jgi:hypothetical protein
VNAVMNLGGGSGTMELYLKMLLLTNYASVLMVF